MVVNAAAAIRPATPGMRYRLVRPMGACQHSLVLVAHPSVEETRQPGHRRVRPRPEPGTRSWARTHRPAPAIGPPEAGDAVRAAAPPRRPDDQDRAVHGMSGGAVPDRYEGRLVAGGLGRDLERSVP